MLKKINLTNFKCHEALVVEFGNGLTAVKGNVEKGKSSLIQGITYALFGAKALPYTLEDTVTHGKPVNTLKVVLDFSVDGIDYTISRGRGGAQLDYAGGTVTGQNETAAYIGKLLGTDAQVAPKLILANQNEIRGALAAGAKATTELIEKLAEFDQLDNLIDLIQNKLVTGTTAVAESALAAAQKQMDDLPKKEAPNAEKMLADENDAAARVTALTESIALNTTKHREAAAALRQLEQANADIERCENNVVAARGRLAEAEAALSGIKLPKKPNRDVLPMLRGDVADLQGQLALEKVLKAVKPHLGLEPQFEGSAELLDREIDGLRRSAEAWKIARTKVNASIETLGALKVAGSCSLCGKDVSEVPEVVAKNEEIDLNIAEATKEAATLAAKISQGLKDEVELMAIKTASKAALAAAAKYGAHLTVNADVMPPTLTWAGPTDFEVVKGALADAESKLAKLEETVSAYDKAAARKEEAEKRVNAAKADLQHAVDQLAGRKPVSTGAAQMLVQTAEATVAGDRSLLDAARATLEAARSYRREAVAAWESHLKLMAQIEGTIAQRQAELKTLQFNNTLLKAVRTARPVIADKLWSLVLGAVSRYFSEMRGERSLVTKTTDGFVVDGHSAATLSGSTLDILGLAVRVALVRTFVPHAPLLVLDEPTAAMDAERTATTLGFLAATGFKQTIIVSHEEATEAVADHLIQL